VHLGAKRIVLLGYDMQRSQGRSHFFDHSPARWSSNYAEFRSQFETLVDPLFRIGVSVVNCSRETALTAFPRQALREALP